MKGKLLLGIGAAIGYVLGTRAGRDSYDAMKAQADALWHDPRVQDKVAEANQLVRDKAPDVQHKISDAASAVKSKVGQGDAGSASAGYAAGPSFTSDTGTVAEPAGSEVPPPMEDIPPVPKL